MVDKNLANDACPVCGSTSIEGWEVTIEGNLAIQACACGDCGRSRNDVYELRDRVVLEEDRLWTCHGVPHMHQVRGAASATSWRSTSTPLHDRRQKRHPRNLYHTVRAGAKLPAAQRDEHVLCGAIPLVLCA